MRRSREEVRSSQSRDEGGLRYHDITWHIKLGFQTVNCCSKYVLHCGCNLEREFAGLSPTEWPRLRYTECGSSKWDITAHKEGAVLLAFLLLSFGYRSNHLMLVEYF